jgi:hypothetical protein
MKLKKNEVLPMGFGLSTGGEYRILPYTEQKSTSKNIVFSWAGHQ